MDSKMNLKHSKWKKIENSLKFITLSKTSLKDSKNPSLKVIKLFKSKWPLLKHTLSVVHYLLRTLLNDLKLNCVSDIVVKTDTSEKPPKVSSQRSKWKKVENSLHFITLSKNCVKASKASVTVDIDTNKQEESEKADKSIKKGPNPNLIKAAKSKWTILKHTVSVVNYLVKMIFKNLQLNSSKVTILKATRSGK